MEGSGQLACRKQLGPVDSGGKLVARDSLGTQLVEEAVGLASDLVGTVLREIAQAPRNEIVAILVASALDGRVQVASVSETANVIADVDNGLDEAGVDRVGASGSTTKTMRRLTQWGQRKR